MSTIQIDRMPAFALNQAFAVLSESIQRALEDPAVRAEFEAWRKTYREGKEGGREA